MLPATCSIVTSYAVFFRGASVLSGVVVWLVVAALLALPWAMAKGPWSTLAAAVLSGALGPISIWPLAGLLFPSAGLGGLFLLVLLVFCAGEIGALVVRGRPAFVTANLYPFFLAGFLYSNVVALVHGAPKTPAGWVAVNTFGLRQTGPDVFAGLRNTQRVIDAGRGHGDARVLVFPEAALNDMLPGTVAMVSHAVPPGQIWLVGAEDGKHDAIWQFESDRKPRLATDSALPMPGSMWRPWDPAVSYVPAWRQSTFHVGRLRVWSSICYEQVVPWSWVEALLARPGIVLLQSNAWWAGPGNPAPAIQRAQASAWVRLMGVTSLAVSNETL